MKATHRFIHVLILISLIACNKKEHAEQVNNMQQEEWPQMDSFHLIMAESFHPYEDSANIEPLKRLATEMAEEAAAWAIAELPERVNNKQMKTRLNQLKADTQTLAEKVNMAAPDGELGVALKSLHDSFHTIMEEWNGAAEHTHKH